jgi:hypothetical protein
MSKDGLNKRIDVRVSPEFHAAICALAAEQECSPASLVLRAAKAYLSKCHRWETGTRGRPFARRRIGKESGLREAG